MDVSGKFMVHLQKSVIPFRDYKISEEPLGLVHGDDYYLIKDGVTYEKQGEGTEYFHFFGA